MWFTSPLQLGLYAEFFFYMLIEKTSDHFYSLPFFADSPLIWYHFAVSKRPKEYRPTGNLPLFDACQSSYRNDDDSFEGRISRFQAMI